MWLALLVVLLVALPIGFQGLGAWLVVEDELGPADAIYIHSGRVPFRAIEGATVALSAPGVEVWLTMVRPSEASDVLAEMGIHRRAGWDTNREVLERLGVASDRIRILDSEVVNTRDEIKSVLAEMERRDLDRVVLVTSEYHARRVRALWRHYSHGSRTAMIRPSHDDPFDPDRWWRDMDQARAVANEVVALADLWLGAPLSGEN